MSKFKFEELVPEVDLGLPLLGEEGGGVNPCPRAEEIASRPSAPISRPPPKSKAPPESEEPLSSPPPKSAFNSSCDNEPSTMGNLFSLVYSTLKIYSTDFSISTIHY
jgi:hypothetical protein